MCFIITAGPVEAGSDMEVRKILHHVLAWKSEKELRCMWLAVDSNLGVRVKDLRV